MRSGKQLAQTVRGMDGKGYRTYKEIRGSYSFGDFELHIEHVQPQSCSALSHRLHRTLLHHICAEKLASFFASI